MVYGEKNRGVTEEQAKNILGEKPGNYLHTDGFYPQNLGQTTISKNYVSVGVMPDDWNDKLFDSSNQKSGASMDQFDDVKYCQLKGASGYRRAISDVIIPLMEEFDPQLLIISAGFDGFSSDPIGNELNLSLEDFSWVTKKLVASMRRPEGSGKGRVVSLLEGGYDTSETLGLARCIDVHVKALRDEN
jgi:hypothetical protein